MHIRDDGAIIFQEGIEERGFAHVGLADNSHGDTLFEGLTRLETMCQTDDVFVNVFGEFQ